jgi:DNA helicase-2/ATP-dependent DNA helicase PcrA
MNMWDVVSDIRNHGTGIHSGAANKMTEFSEMIIEFTLKLKEKDAWNLAKEIADKSGVLKDLFADKSAESVSRHENVQELLNGIKEFTENDVPKEEKHLDNYLESVALLTNEDNESEDDKNKVTLMTIHSSKGLEFRNVYIVGVEERLFPSEMSSYSTKDLEEERRLFYVAITRAEKELMITYTRQRYRWGQLYDCTPSRFIKDIDSKYIDFLSAYSRTDSSFDHDLKSYNSVGGNSLFKADSGGESFIRKKKFVTASKMQKRSTEKSSNSNSENYKSNVKIQIGDLVEHNRFGKGEVIHIEGNFPNTKAIILFESAGKKNLLLKFAKLKRIN